MSARSFCISAGSVDALERALRETRGAVSTPTCGLLFVSGDFIQHLAVVAGRVQRFFRGVPTVIVPSAGVLHERGEHEGTSAVSGIFWSGGRVTPIFMGGAHETPQSIGERIGQTIGRRRGTAVLFHRAEGFDPSLLEAIAEIAPQAVVFGAGTVGGDPTIITEAGEQHTAQCVGVFLEGLAPPLVRAAPACRLISPLQPIEDVSAGLVLRVGGRSALSALSRSAPSASASATPSPLVLAALAYDDDLTEEGQPRFMIRPVRGVDPSRQGVMIGGEARPGMKLGFAIRDAVSARAETEAMVRAVAQAALGSAPRFALYLTCAGRGQALYGAPDVESRILRQRFGDLPIAGLHSAFEISPRQGHASRLEMYTSVLALFRSPS